MWAVLISCLVTLVGTVTAKESIRPSSQKLQVFILAGQSNMEGQGFTNETENDGRFKNGTLEWMVETYPDRYGHIKDGNDWAVSDNVWIAYNQQSSEHVRPEWNHYGKLTAGFGSGPERIGPELGFGFQVGIASALEDSKILLLKVAWGGKSLAVDFRPPSSGGTTGLYYEAMLADIFHGLSRLENFVPGTDGYEIQGFAWHQGWNDGCDANMTAEYEFNLANLIRDVRQDLGIPDLPFSIGVSGMTGWNPSDPTRTDLANAQLAVAQYDEFQGTVATVETRSFFRTVEESPGDQIYHWNNNCESYWLVGEAMGKAMVEMLPSRLKYTMDGNQTKRVNYLREVSLSIPSIA